MNPRELQRQLHRHAPKTYAAIDRRWDIKMIGDVTDFTFHLLEMVNPKACAALDKGEWLIKGPDIEEEIWKLLKKVRRITLRESNNRPSRRG